MYRQHFRRLQNNALICFNFQVRCASNVDNIIRSIAKPVIIPKNGLIHEHLLRKIRVWDDRIAVKNNDNCRDMNNSPLIAIPNKQKIFASINVTSKDECIDTGRKYTYSDIDRKSTSFGEFLQNQLKLKPHSIVGIILPNVPEYPIVFLGALLAGCTVTTVNPNYTPDEIRRQITDSQASLVVTLSQKYAQVQKAINNLNIRVIIIKHENTSSIPDATIDFNEIINYVEGGHLNRQVSSNDVAIIPYSSGTTGLPKGVQISHGNIIANLFQSSVDEFDFMIPSEGSHQDVIPAFLPLFHIYGLFFFLISALWNGVRVITIPRLNNAKLIKLLRDFRPSVIYLVPPVVHMILNNPEIEIEDLLPVRTIVSGAAPLGTADVERFRDKTGGKVDLLQGYGMTETSSTVMCQSKLLKNGVKIGGSGFLLPNTEGKIIPLEGNSIKGLRPCEKGELWVRGPQVMKGYLNNEKATRDIITEHGWLKTGDIGYYDEDTHIFITDRLKELIKVKGFQVAPAELEELLRSHPCVKDAAVIGIPHPKFGEVPRAFIVSKDPSPAKISELQDFVASKVVEFKRLIGGIVFVDSIPKSASGKILRRKLKFTSEN